MSAGIKQFVVFTNHIRSQVKRKATTTSTTPGSYLLISPAAVVVVVVVGTRVLRFPGRAGISTVGTDLSPGRTFGV